MLENDSLKDNYFNNTDGINFTNVSSSLPLRLKISPFYKSSTNETDSPYSETNLSKTIVSGALFDFSISLTDSQGKTLKYDKYSRSRLRKHENSSAKITKGLAQTSSGVHFYKEVKINMRPNTRFIVHADVEFVESETLPFILESNSENERDLILDVLSRPCIVGEIFVSADESCVECPSGEYSLANPMKDGFVNQGCKVCPENAFCGGGDSILPQKGFWRADQNSSLVIECVAKDACLGDGDNMKNFTQLEG